MSKKLIIVVACPDRGAGNDPEPLRLALIKLDIKVITSLQHYSKSYEWIEMKFYGGVQGG